MLCSTTWAWYSDRASTSQNRITAASFDFTATISQIPISAENTFTVQKEDTVNIELNPADASANGGYCMIQFKNNDGIYVPIAYTSYFETSSSFFFELQTDTELTLRLIPCWGKPGEGVACGKQGERLLIANGTGAWSANDANHTT